MATKLNHTAALKKVYAIVTDNRVFNALAQDKEDNKKVQAARKALTSALVEQYNADADRLSVIGATLRSFAHVLAKEKKVDEESLTNKLLPNGKVTALIDTPDRLATYVATAVNELIDKTTTTKTKVSVPTAQIKKMFAIVGNVEKVAQFFELTTAQVKAIVK